MRIEEGQERYRIIETILCYTDIESFDEITALMSYIDKNYLSTNARNGRRLVDDNGIEVLRKVYLKRLEEFTKSKFLLDSQMGQRAAMLWRKIDYTNYMKYINGVCQDDICAVRFLIALVNEWNDGNGITDLELSEITYKEVVGDIKVVDVINRARKECAFWNLSRNDIIHIAAFSLLVGRNEGDKNKVTIDKVNNLIAEWEREYSAQ